MRYRRNDKGLIIIRIFFSNIIPIKIHFTSRTLARLCFFFSLSTNVSPPNFGGKLFDRYIPCLRCPRSDPCTWKGRWAPINSQLKALDCTNSVIKFELRLTRFSCYPWNSHYELCCRVAVSTTDAVAALERGGESHTTQPAKNMSRYDAGWPMPGSGSLPSTTTNLLKMKSSRSILCREK